MACLVERVEHLSAKPLAVGGSGLGIEAQAGDDLLEAAGLVLQIGLLECLQHLEAKPLAVCGAWVGIDLHAGQESRKMSLDLRHGFRRASKKHPPKCLIQGVLPRPGCSAKCSRAHLLRTLYYTFRAVGAQGIFRRFRIFLRLIVIVCVWGRGGGRNRKGRAGPAF